MRVRQLTPLRRARRMLALALCLALLTPLCLAEEAAYTDYAASVRPDRTGAAARQEVTVKAFVDGDTTHFLVPESVAAGGVLKARYLAVNTPESTGRIEEYGTKAAAFVREGCPPPPPSSSNRIPKPGIWIPRGSGIWCGCGISRRPPPPIAT